MQKIASNEYIYAPGYYKSFKCIADKCRHSCCVDWEICIDDATLEKYKPIKAIYDTVTEGEDGACFKLQDNSRCPHLNEEGLCDIIIKNGEDYLSDICKNHPRFFNTVTGGNREAGLGLVCEEACRIILECEEPFALSALSDSASHTAPLTRIGTYSAKEFNPLPQRDKIIAMAQAEGTSFKEKLESIRKAFGIHELYTENEWIDRLLELEKLDTGWEQILLSVKKDNSISRELTEYEKYYERLLIYFVYRHVSIAESPENLRARLAFAVFSTEMIKYLFEKGKEPDFAKLAELARSYSSEIEYSEDNTAELIFEFESAF